MGRRRHGGLGNPGQKQQAEQRGRAPARAPRRSLPPPSPGSIPALRPRAPPAGSAPPRSWSRSRCGARTLGCGGPRGRKSRIHGFHAAPETVPRARKPPAGARRVRPAGVGGNAQGTTSTPSQVTRATKAAHQQIAFRVRQRSMSATVGSWSTWVAGPRAERAPTPTLEAPKRRA